VCGEFLAVGDFFKYVTKIMHFRRISAKIQPKIYRRSRFKYLLNLDSMVISLIDTDIGSSLIHDHF